MVAAGVVAALVVLSVQFAITRQAYAAELETIEAAQARTGPLVHHISGLRRALNGVYRDLGVLSLPRGREAARRLLSRHWPLIDAHMEALRGLSATPGERAQRAQLEQLLAALRTAEPRLLEARTEADARAVLEWQLLPLVREAVRAADGLLTESARWTVLAGRQLELAHADADRLALVLYGVVLAAVTATGATAFVLVSRADAEVQRRLDELDAFAGRVAHDLRSPLQPALLSATALRAHCPDGTHALIDRLAGSMRQAAELVDALLLFARSGARPEASARALVGDVIRELEPALRELAAAERAALVLEVEPGLEVCTTPAALRSILDNLVRNALLYLDDARTRDVRVVAAADGPRTVVLQVSDTGPGIPAHTRAHLFEPFERGSTRPGGSGLGLATVRRLVDAHGGEIALATRSGGGTTFTVRLPRARPSGGVAGPLRADTRCSPVRDR